MFCADTQTYRRLPLRKNRSHRFPWCVLVYRIDLRGILRSRNRETTQLLTSSKSDDLTTTKETIDGSVRVECVLRFQVQATPFRLTQKSWCSSEETSLERCSLEKCIHNVGTSRRHHCRPWTFVFWQLRKHTLPVTLGTRLLRVNMHEFKDIGTNPSIFFAETQSCWIKSKSYSKWTGNPTLWAADTVYFIVTAHVLETDFAMMHNCAKNQRSVDLCRVSTMCRDTWSRRKWSNQWPTSKQLQSILWAMYRSANVFCDSFANNRKWTAEFWKNSPSKSWLNRIFICSGTSFSYERWKAGSILVWFDGACNQSMILLRYQLHRETSRQQSN